MSKKREGYDIVIVGGGLSALTAAVNIADNHKSLKIAILSKQHPLRSQTGSAQGGINAVLSKDDSFKHHFYDTVRYSDYLADQDKVDAFVKEAPKVIEELERYGAMFTRKEGGDLAQTALAGKAFIAQRDYGGESYPRACYSADKTGQILLQTMYEQARKRGIKILEDHFVMSLVISESSCVGVVALDLRTGETKPIKSHTTIISTGAHGALYKNTTNNVQSTGDGPALVLRSGAHLMDMEFIQYHPLVLKGKRILVSDTIRSDSILLNKVGERFMETYSKRMMENSPRDVITRAIVNEIKHGRGISGSDYVYLDIKHLGEETIDKKYSKFRKLCVTNLGLDPTKDLIPVHPAQHYSLGGIPTDGKAATQIPGLYAAGECACVSLHGANRLGGNSLLETIVFGKRAGNSAADYIEAMREEKLFKPFPDEAEAEDEDYIARLMERKSGEPWSEIKKELNEVMEENVGVFRDEDGLIDALKVIQELKQRFKNVYVNDKNTSFNTELIQVLELRNMLDVAEAIVAGALAREESRGSHFRIDFPEKRNLKYLKHSLIRKTNEGLKLSYKDVNISQFKPE